MSFLNNQCLKISIFPAMAVSLLLSCAAPKPLGPRQTEKHTADGSLGPTKKPTKPGKASNSHRSRDDVSNDLPPSVPTVFNSDTLVTMTVLGSDKDLYRSAVLPMMEKSCLHGGCHAASIVIDLREYPYQAEGSYVWEDIKRDLGESPDPEKAQRMLADSLLSSIKTGYMPQGFEAPIPSPEETDIYEAWIDEGMKIPALSISGELVVLGFEDGEIALTQNFTVSDGQSQLLLEFEKFKNADKISFHYFDTQGELKSTLNIGLDNFWSKTAVKMSMKSE